MRDEHIVDGDYVLVEHTATARQGEIIVALVRNSETTLKRYYIEGTMVRLQPSNTEMEPIYVPPVANRDVSGSRPRCPSPLRLERFRNYCGLKGARSGSLEKTAKGDVASVYTNCETAVVCITSRGDLQFVQPATECTWTSSNSASPAGTAGFQPSLRD